VAAWYEQVV